MKKFLLSFLTVLSSLLFFDGNAQLVCSGGPSNCSIAATNISSAVSQIDEVNGKCQKTTNVTFTLSHNSGVKYVNFYFFNNSFPAGFSCGSEPTAATGNLGAYIALTYNSGVWSIHGTGIGGTGLTPQTGYTLSTTTVTGGTSFTLTGVKFLSDLPCASNNIVLYIGGTNAASNGIQCYSTSNFTPYIVSIGGKIDCGAQSNPLNYDLIIDANYQNPPGTPAVISGTYQVYIDVNNNNVIDGPDVNLTPVAEAFATSTVGAPIGLSRYTDFDNVIPLANGDPNSTKNLLVRVTPSTPGVAAVTGQLTNTCSTLPVSLKSFNAVMRSGKANLTWETLLEEHNDGFEIERRIGNGQYQKIGFVDSKAQNGNGTAYSYSFDDNLTLPKGITYYRLRQVDLDGRATYSEVKAVRAGNSQLVISIYPNPNRGATNVAIPESAGKMDITLNDYTGKSIQQWSGISVRNLQINNMKPGIYMLRINMRETGEVITERIVVQ